MSLPARQPPLETAFETPESKRRYVRRLFGTIAARYDLITRLLSFGQDQRWKRRLLDLAGVHDGTRVLDLACGTGDLSALAAARGAAVVGLDFSLPMLRRAQAKSTTAGVRWVEADLGVLPLQGASFDVVTVGYGLRNAAELVPALAEMHRVLQPGGRLASLDFDRPDAAWIRRVYLGYLTAVGASLGWLLHRDPDTYRYIPASIRRYPGARGVAALLYTAGFADVRHVRVLGGLMAIHLARKPEPDEALSSLVRGQP
jgi:demethylmenaquinone methyltransferase/2-methoxy-6-polyprenyl-1,4-benzoquinol methylase